MAIIPRTTESVQMNVNSPVPIAGTGDARIQGQALENLGNSLSSAADKVTGYLDKQADFNRSINVNDGANEMANIAQQARVYAGQNSKPDGSDIEEVATQFSQAKVNDTMNKYGVDKIARAQLQGHLNRIQSDMGTTLMADRVQKAERFTVDSLDRTGNVDADTIYGNPSTGMVEAKVANFNTLIDKATQVDPKTGLAVIDSANAEKIKQATLKKYAGSFVRGLSEQGEPGIRQAINYLKANQTNPDINSELSPETARGLGLIDGAQANALAAKGEKFKYPVMSSQQKLPLSPQMVQVMNGLDPDDKERMIDSLQRQLKDKSEMRMSDFNANLNGLESYGLSGNALLDGDVDRMKAQAMQLEIPRVAKERILNRIDTAKIVSDRMRDVALTPDGDMDSLRQKISGDLSHMADKRQRHDPLTGEPETDFAMMKDHQDALHRFDILASKAIKERNDDPVDYLMANDHDVPRLNLNAKQGMPGAKRAYYDTLIAKQQRLGIDKPRVMTLAESQEMAEKIQSQPDAASINKNMSALEAEYGEKYFPMAAAEVAETNKKVGEYAAVGMLAPSAVRAPIFAALRDESAINERFKNLTDTDIKKKAINEAINNTDMVQMRRALGDSSSGASLQFSNNLEKAMRLTLMSRVATDPTIDIDSEAKKVYSQYVGKQFAVSSTAIGGGSRVAVPTKYGGDSFPDLVTKTIQTYSMSENIALLHPKPPAGLSDEDYALVLEKQGRWENTADKTGIRFVRIDDAGRKTQVMDKLGHPIKKQFQDIASNADLKVKNTHIYSHGKFLGKVTDMVTNVFGSGAKTVAPAAEAEE